MSNKNEAADEDFEGFRPTNEKMMSNLIGQTKKLSARSVGSIVHLDHFLRQKCCNRKCKFVSQLLLKC